MNRTLVAVVVPILVLVLWVAKLQLGATTGAEVTLSITGYDPRDLLAGHYLRYRVSYDLETLCAKASKEPTCVCLEYSSDAQRHQATWAGSCEELSSKSCGPLFLRGVCDESRFVAGIERYYIPEAYSEVLATVPGDASIRVKLDGDGSSQVTAMYVGAERVEDYAQRLLSARKDPE